LSTAIVTIWNDLNRLGKAGRLLGWPRNTAQNTTEDTRKRRPPKSETEVPPSGCALYRVPDLQWRFADMSFSRAHLKLTTFAAMAPVRSPPPGSQRAAPAKMVTSAPAE
jgi:hypothetical protein